MPGGFVYIMANRRLGTTYIGVTNDVTRRAFEHREGLGSAFVKRYRLFRLVYIERYERIDEAIAREKQLKAWRRAWKWELIERVNPEWADLYPSLNA